MTTKTLNRQNDLVFAAKAIHDDLKEQVNALVTKSRDDTLLRLDALVARHVKTLSEKGFVKDLRAEFTKELGELSGQYLSDQNKMITDLSEHVKALQNDFKADVTSQITTQIKSLVSETVNEVVGQHFKDLDTDFVLRMAKALDKNFDRLVTDGLANRFESLSAEYKSGLAAMQDAFDIREQKLLAFITKSHSDGLGQIHEVLKAITISPPQIVVNVPEQLPPVVHVTAAEQLAPVVHVTVPEVKLPEIKMLAAPPRRVVKMLEYDEFGRPTLIRESEQSILTEQE